MNNWFYNEVEMMNKHKMLNKAGRKQQPTGEAADSGRRGFVPRLLAVLGRSLARVGGALTKRHAPAAGGQVLAETKQN